MAVFVLLVSGCGMSRIKDIRLDSVGVKYVVPTSGRSLDALLELGIDNPAMSFTVQDVKGTIYCEDRTIASFTTGPVNLEGKTRQVYQLPCTVQLDEGTSFLSLLILLAKHSTLEGFKADVNMYVANASGALRAPISFKNMDLSQFTR